MCRSINRETSPDRFASSTNSRRNAAPAALLFACADRLLHRGELAVEDPRAGQLFEVRQQARPQTGHRIHLVVDELLERRTAAAFRADHFGMLDVAGEPQIVGAPGADRDAHAGPVDIGDRLQRRTRRHQIGRLDLDIGRGERDFFGTLRLGADQPDVPDAVSGRVGQLARPRIGHISDRHAQALGDLARHVGGHALRIARRGLSGNQEEIPHIDRGAQDAGRGEFGGGLFRHEAGPE